MKVSVFTISTSIIGIAIGAVGLFNANNNYTDTKFSSLQGQQTSIVERVATVEQKTTDIKESLNKIDKEVSDTNLLLRELLQR